MMSRIRGLFDHSYCHEFAKDEYFGKRVNGFSSDYNRTIILIIILIKSKAQRKNLKQIKNYFLAFNALLTKESKIARKRKISYSLLSTKNYDCIFPQTAQVRNKRSTG